MSELYGLIIIALMLSLLAIICFDAFKKCTGIKYPLVIGIVSSVLAVASVVAYTYDYYTGILTEACNALQPKTIEIDGHTYVLDETPESIVINGKTYILSEAANSVPEEISDT